MGIGIWSMCCTFLHNIYVSGVCLSIKYGATTTILLFNDIGCNGFIRTWKPNLTLSSQPWNGVIAWAIWSFRWKTLFCFIFTQLLFIIALQLFILFLFSSSLTYFKFNTLYLTIHSSAILKGYTFYDFWNQTTLYHTDIKYPLL